MERGYALNLAVFKVVVIGNPDHTLSFRNSLSNIISGFFSLFKDFLNMFAALLDAHTFYYLPTGYGSVFYTAPFIMRSKLVNGEQKYFTGPAIFPYDLWVQACGASCPYTEDMLGFEITDINGMTVKDFINSWTPGGGTYYDDGVRANSFIAGSGWIQAPLLYNALPPNDFSITLVNPATDASATMTLPFAFGGTGGAFSTTKLTTNNLVSNTKRGDFSLLAERDLLHDLQVRMQQLTKRSAPVEKVQRTLSAIAELSANMERVNKDSSATERILKRDGFKALDGSKLPFIPSERQRMEDVIRLSQALWDHTVDLKAADAKIDEYVKRMSSSATRKVVAKSSTATAEEKPIIPGDSSLFHMYTTVTTPSFEQLDAWYASYNGTTVLRLGSFDDADGKWVLSVNGAIQSREAYGLNDNLIIDVTNNGGGLVCLNYHTMSVLVNAWSDLTRVYGDDLVYSLYDMRISSPIGNGLADSSYLASTGTKFNPNNGASVAYEGYFDPSNRTIGSKTSSYAKIGNWNPCGSFNGWFSTPTEYHFDKIIVITDGRCGSSCAYFVSQLRENDKVRVVSYGGLYGEALATSSFAGGNVLSYVYVRSVLTSLPLNPYTSPLNFNFRANYSPDKYPATPRQFDRLEADWYLPLWDSFYRYFDGDEYNATARFTLYASVLPLFDEVPSNLSRAEAPPPPPMAEPITPESPPDEPIAPSLAQPSFVSPPTTRPPPTSAAISPAIPFLAVLLLATLALLFA